MAFKSEHWVSRNLGSFQSALKDIILAKDSTFSIDRPGNKVDWHTHKANEYSASGDSKNNGDPIIASSISYWVSKLNNEIITRNSIFKDLNLAQVSTTGLISGETVNSAPYVEATKIFKKLLGDDYSGSTPEALTTLKSADTSILVLSLRDKFVRFPFNSTNVKTSKNTHTITYQQTFNYFGADSGVSSQNTTYEDLAFLENFLKTADSSKKSGKINAGVLTKTGEISWFNNLWVKSLTTSIIDTGSNESVLTARPEGWENRNPGESNESQGDNFSYVKDQTNHLKLVSYKDTSKELTQTEKYNENIDWEFKTRVVDITVVLENDPDLKSFTELNIPSYEVLAEHINKYKEYTNKLTEACICNCNYCTCDCNYCTCNCNYCTCNCNYCTCNCNYCTCNCNYKSTTVESSDSQKLIASWPSTYWQTLCSCDANKGQWWHWEYGIQTSCPSNRTFWDYCPSHKNGTSSWVTKSFNTSAEPVAACACDSNKKAINYQTSLFNSTFTKTTTQFDGRTSELAKKYQSPPTFSKAVTRGSGSQESISDLTKSATEISAATAKVCICNVNVNVQKSTSTIRADQYLWKEVEVKNLDGSYQRTKEFKTLDELKALSSEFSVVPTSLFNGDYSSIGDYKNKTGDYPYILRTITVGYTQCPANKDYESRVNFKQFWDGTVYKKGPETK